MYIGNAILNGFFISIFIKKMQVSANSCKRIHDNFLFPSRLWNYRRILPKFQ
jgi:hypothetical protein